MPKKKETRGRKKIYKTETQKKKAVMLTNQKWATNNTKSYAFRFMEKRDYKVIEKLDSVPNKVDYIRQLILADIEKTGD